MPSMWLQRCTLALALASVSVNAASLRRAAPTKVEPAKTVVKVEAAKSAPTATDVAQLRTNLEGIATGLEGMISGQGALADAKIRPTLEVFVKELRSSLQTISKVKDPATAMQQLETAKAGVSVLMKELTKQQESLMKEDETQRESLLLGELMTKQNATLAQQLEVLTSADYEKLAVSKALIAKHNTTALYTQAAAYLDSHGGQAAVTLASEKVQHSKNMIITFEKRAQVLEREYAKSEKFHADRMASFDKSIKGAKRSESYKLGLIKRRSDRSFQKQQAMKKHLIDGLNNAVKAMKSGDMKALDRARAALAESMKAMEAQAGGFLHLLQLGARLTEERDCPFCAAQCVEKCHSGGASYVMCMTQCADAGKGF